MAAPLLKSTCYDLEATLESGQAFRWRQVGDTWEGIIHGSIVRVSNEEGLGIRILDCSPNLPLDRLQTYFQSQLPLIDYLDQLPQDPYMQKAIQACQGLHILRQDPWETLVSFLMSTNKQIPHIKIILNKLCQRFGSPIDHNSDGEHSPFSFPSAERIAEASIAELRDCRMGYRATYLSDTAKKVVNEKIQLQTLQNLNYTEAKKQLTAFAGVGEKVANCVLLFAYDFQEAFPVDVWIARVLRKEYFNGRPVSIKTLQTFADEYFQPYPGYAQQYLFHYIRKTNQAR